ncbi:MAG: porin [Pseudomonadota bacterium]
MKKTLIALAALSSIAGVAQAQSSVTLYGLVDAYVGSRSVTVGGTKTTQTVVNSSGQNKSRFGFRGVEDLGGGLKAVFVLEGGFNTDDGAGNLSGGGLFSRQANVGLTGGFGTVKIGRVYTAYDALRGATNMIYDSNFAITANAWNGGSVADYANRTSNGFSYESPSFGGFSGAFVAGVGEDKNAVGTQTASRNFSLHVKYANGPLMVGYAHQNQKFNGGTTIFSIPSAVAVSTRPARYNLFAASYDFGVAKIVGNYNHAAQDANLAGVPENKDKEYQVGVSVPFGAAAIAAGYARSKSDNTSAKGVGYSILGTYSLSKRTNLYTGLLQTKLTTAAPVTTKVNLFAVGVKHTF